MVSLSESDDDTMEVNYYICMVHHGTLFLCPPSPISKSFVSLSESDDDTIMDVSYYICMVHRGWIPIINDEIQVLFQFYNNSNKLYVCP